MLRNKLTFLTDIRFIIVLIVALGIAAEFVSGSAETAKSGCGFKSKQVLQWWNVAKTSHMNSIHE